MVEIVKVSKFWSDLIERAGWAFVEGTVSGVVLARASDINMWWAALAAGLAPALSIMKSALATRVGDSGSASLSKKI